MPYQAVWNEENMMDEYVWIDDVLAVSPLEAQANAFATAMPYIPQALAPEVMPFTQPVLPPVTMPQVQQGGGTSPPVTMPQVQQGGGTSPLVMDQQGLMVDAWQGARTPAGSPIVEAGLPLGLIATIGKAILPWATSKIGGGILGGIGAAAAGWGIAQITDGDGGGVTADGGVAMANGMDLGPGLGFTPSGPGVPEPPAQIVAKQWKRMVMSNRENYWIYFFRLVDGRTALYNPRKGWKVWRDYKSIVIGKSLTTRNVVQVSRRLRLHVKSLSKVLKILK